MMIFRALLLGLMALTAAAPSVTAQPRDGTPRVALVSPVRTLEEMTETGIPTFVSFLKTMRQLGWSEGETVTIGRFTAGAQAERYAEVVDEALDWQPDVLFAASTPIARLVKSKTNNIPTVFFLPDPVATGLVASLARPGGNLTGVTTIAGKEIEGKRLQLLADLLPGTPRVAYLVARTRWEREWKDVMLDAARVLDVPLVPVIVESPFDEGAIRLAFGEIDRANVDALHIAHGAESQRNFATITALARERNLPTICHIADCTDAGGLMSYGTNYPDRFVRVAHYVDKILRGANPAEIPVEQPMEFDLIINLATARALDFTIPNIFLMRANEIIE